MNNDAELVMAMNNDLSEFVNRFPHEDFRSKSADKRRQELNSNIIELLRQIGYPDSVIHRDVPVSVGEEVYEPTHVSYGDSFSYRVYVAESPDHLPYLVGRGHILGNYPIGGIDQQVLIESMRAEYEMSEPEFVIALSNYDIYIYSQTSDSGEFRERYSLEDWDPDNEEDLIKKLKPPSKLPSIRRCNSEVLEDQSSLSS